MLLTICYLQLVMIEPPLRKPNESDSDYARRCEFVAWRAAGGVPELPKSPEPRVTKPQRLPREPREPRPPVSAVTRAKMSAARSGPRNYRSRPVWIKMPGSDAVEHPSVTAAAKSLGVPQQVVFSWLSGTLAWPGQGPRGATKLTHLTGLTGGYLKPSGKPRNPYLDRSKKLIEVELTFSGQNSERFRTVHDAAKRADVRHLVMYLWLTGERPWPDGLTGRAITPL